MITTGQTVTLRTAARLLGYGPNKLTALLRRVGVLDANNRPLRRYVESGDFQVVVKSWHGSHDIEHQYTQTRVTGRGTTLLQRIIDEHGEETAAVRRRDHGADGSPAAPGGPGTGPDRVQGLG